jgi:DNA replication protein DnaC
MSDSAASGSPEVLALTSNPDVVMPLSTGDYQRLEETYSGLWSDPSKTCLTCEKKNEFRTMREGREVLMRCECVEQWMLHLWMLNAGLGLAYQRLGWHHIDGIAQATRDKIIEYLDHSMELTDIGHALTLWGPPGTGKTLLLTLVQRMLMGFGFDTYFCLFNQLINLHTAGWRSDDSRRWFERRVMNAGHLFIDDMGKENAGRGGEMIGSLVDELLRHRIQHGRTTFVSTNVKPEDLEDRYYTGTLGLFTEVNAIIEVQGENYRDVRRQQLADQAKKGLRFPVVIG